MPARTKPKKVWRFEISVWDWEGDVVEKHWRATEDERDEIEERYSDDPLRSVVIDREWEEDGDED